MQNKNKPVFFYHIKPDKKTNTSNTKRNPFTQTKMFDLNTKNEIIMSKIIEQINGYNDRFHIILKYSMINITEVDNDLGLVKRERKEPYLFLSYSFVDFPTILSFSDYFFNENSHRKTAVNIINSFKYLLKSLETLWNNKIVHFNLNFKSIVFNHIDNPFIRDFSQSFSLLNLNEERKNRLFGKTCITSQFDPLEKHICTFLYKNTNCLSKTNINELCEHFFYKNLNSLNVFSEDILEECKEHAIFSLQPYINKPNSEVINDIINNCTIYWDLYGLCLTYLLLIKETVNESYSYCFFDDLTELLTTTIISIFLRKKISHCQLLIEFDNIIENCNFDDFML
jgi:hypothetical protein